MKIVILGAGAVGSTLANLLSQENDLTIVDNDPVKLHKLEEEADIKTLLGNASYPNILVSVKQAVQRFLLQWQVWQLILQGR